MKLKLLIGLALLLGTPSIAQNTSNEGQWTLLTTDHNVSVYYEKGNCGGANTFLLRIVNSNNKDVSVDWSLFDGTSKTLEVKANETITGACTNRLPMAHLVQVIPAGKSEKDLHAIIHVTVKP